MFGWFDASEAEKFGRILAQVLIEKVPVDSPITKEKLLIKKQDAALNKIAQEVLRFKIKTKLNVYKKAKLGNAFKWTLKDAGYDASYVDQLTSWLMLQI